MSTRYQHGDRVPSDVLVNRLDELAGAVGQGPEVRDREFTRRIPAELDRDADLVLSESANRIKELEADRDALAAFRSAICGWRENDWPKSFSRSTAELLAEHGRQAEAKE